MSEAPHEQSNELKRKCASLRKQEYSAMRIIAKCVLAKTRITGFFEFKFVTILALAS